MLIMQIQEKIKEFFEIEEQKIVSRIEKTPMEKFFLFFLIIISVAAVFLGYLQFKRNIEMPLLSLNMSEKRSELRQQYLANLNTATSYTLPQIINSPININGEETNINAIGNVNQADLNSAMSSSDLLDLEQKLLSGEVTLEQLGINDPELQKYFDLAKASQLNGTDGIASLDPQEKAKAIDALKALTPAQIREELIKNGADKASLDQIDDQTLQQMFLETLSTYQ